MKKNLHDFGLLRLNSKLYGSRQIKTSTLENTFKYALPLAPAAHGKDPGSGNTVVPDPGNVKGFGDPLTPVSDVTGFPKKQSCN